MAGGLFTQASLHGLRPILSYRAIDLGAGPVGIGVLAASFAVIPIFMAVPLGRLTDRRGERSLAMFGGTLTTVACVLFIVVDTFALLVALNVVLGVGHLLLSLSQQAYVGRGSDSDTRDVSFARFTLTGSLGQMAGPLMATYAGSLGVDVGTGFFVASFGVCAVCQFSALVATSFFRRTDRRDRRSADAGSARLAAILRPRGVKPAVFASMVALATVDLLMAYVPLWAEGRGIGAVAVGWLLAVRGATSLISRILLTWCIGKLGGHVQVAILSAALSAVAIGSLPFFGLIPAYISVAALGLALGLMQPLTMAWVVGLTPPNDVAAALGVRLSSNRIGQVAVPMAAAAIAGTGLASSADWVFLLSSGLLMASSATSLQSLRNQI